MPRRAAFIRHFLRELYGCGDTPKNSDGCKICLEMKSGKIAEPGSGDTPKNSDGCKICPEMKSGRIAEPGSGATPKKFRWLQDLP